MLTESTKSLAKMRYLIIVFLLIGNNTLAQAPIYEYAAQSITKDDLKEYLKVLTSDNFEGRETGKTGQKLAGKYLAKKMKEFGLKPGNDTSFFQTFIVNELKPSGEITIENTKYDFLNQFFYFPGIKNEKLDFSQIVFCGYGIDDPKYSDYAKIDVKGKVILILEGEPKKNDSISIITGTTKPSGWAKDIRKKSRIAKDKGAAAVFYYTPGYASTKELLHHFIEKPTMRLKEEINEDDERSRVGFFLIGEEMLQKILEKSKTTKKEISRILASKGKPKKYPIIKTSGSILIERKSSDLTAENVIGFIEGTDKKEEIIIITAHYDHLGKIGDEIFYGADDDGSGTAAILEIGQAFQYATDKGFRPRRSIIIMPVSGEEKGLLGSKYYTMNPTVKLENIVANLNIDMIGRRDEKYKDNPDYIYVIGSDKISTELKIINDSCNNKYTNLILDYMYDDPNDPNKYYYRSDHYNFAKNNIPVIFYFNGVHEDYHKSTDTFDKIEFDKMEKITRLVFYTAWELANRDNRLKIDEKN